MVKSNGYEVIADRILAMLDEGVPPWRQPWVTRSPRSWKGDAYRGINALMLGLTGYEDPRWITYRQALKQGGHVLKGEKSMPVVFWNWIDKEDEATGQVAHRPFVRIYRVFNVQQCDGVDLPSMALPDGEIEPIQAANDVVAAYADGPAVRHGGASAAYSSRLDVIRMPHRGDFDSADAYYATLFHELAHSTGHESRIGRRMETEFGTHAYGREELVAEFGAAFLCARAGIDPAREAVSAAYVESWIRTIGAGKRLVVEAAAAGQRAADHVLGEERNRVAAAEAEAA